MTRQISLILCSLFLATVAAAQVSKLNCNGPQNGHIGSVDVCRELSLLVAHKAMELQLELTKDEPSILAGRLVWMQGGKRMSGPVVEVTSSDRPLDFRAARRLAQGIMATTDLP